MMVIYWHDMVGAYLVLSLSFVATVSAYGPAEGANCRCLTSQACFPGSDVLNAFNASVGGGLILPRPTAWSCYPANFDAQTCDVAKDASSNAYVLSAKFPGGMQDRYWEELGAQTCPLETANSGGQCQQGRVSPYGVQAATVADIQNTILFAVKHNLRLFVQNTGHDYLGRSTAPGSFMLWLNQIRMININMTFQPTGCSKVAAGPAVTVSGGVPWFDVYTKVSKDTNDQYVVVGGDCPTVGACGGYTMGGGHSFLMPTFGMSVDNVLQFEVVTADGAFQVVNECQNPDLFWALRGGGGGTFGVVTSITHKLIPSPVYWTSVELTVTPQPVGALLTTAQIEQIWTIFLKFLPSMDEARWSAYTEVGPARGFGGTFLMPISVDEVNKILVPLVAAFADMEKAGVVKVLAPVKAHPSYFAWMSNHQWTSILNVTIVGQRVLVGSRIIPLAALQDQATMVKTMTAAGAFTPSIVAFLLGGRGTRERDVDGLATSVTRSWRRSVLFSGFLIGWAPGTSADAISTQANAMQAGVQVMRDAFPNEGTYFNEAAIEPDFKQALWGDNYPRLLKIKHTVDPNGLFYCTQCVASDEWSADGNCRL